MLEIGRRGETGIHNSVFDFESQKFVELPNSLGRGSKHPEYLLSMPTDPLKLILQLRLLSPFLTLESLIEGSGLTDL